MMNIPYLVVMTGFPSSGKTTAANYLRDELGFTRISTDDLREMFFGFDYETYRSHPAYDEREGIIYQTAHAGKIHALLSGFNVVIDSAAPTPEHRDFFFGTSVGSRIIDADKNLVYVRTNEETLRSRNRERGRTNDVVAEWKHWVEPYESPNCRLVVYDNNIKDDLEIMLSDLERKFKERKLIIQP